MTNFVDFWRRRRLRRCADRELNARIREQRAVARLARCALSDPDLPAVMREAVEVVAGTLDVEFAKLLRFDPAQDSFVWKVVAGYPKDLVHVLKVPADRGQAGYTLEKGEAVCVEDFLKETRFQGSEVLTSQKIRSGVSVVIEGGGGAYGVLAAHSRQPGRFGPDEMRFMQTLADVLGQAIERKASEEELKARERQFKTLAENAPDIVARFDRDCRYVFANSVFAERYGIPREEVIGRTPLELGSPPEASERVKEMVRVAIDDGIMSSGIFTYRRPDGNDEFYDLRVVPEPAGSHGIERTALALIRDVTASRRSDERIRFQASLLDAIGEAVVAVDLDHRIVYWNRQATRLSGWEEEEVLGRKGLRLGVFHDHPREILEITRGVFSGEPWSGELTLARRNGETFPALANLAPTRNEGGKIVGLVGAFSDLTARRNLEEQLRQAQKMEAVGRLAGGIAHDFNNILTSIRGYADLQLSDVNAQESSNLYAREVRDAADRAAGLTRQLLAYSRKQVLNPQVIELGSVVSEADRLLRRVLGEHIDLIVECEPDAGLVRVDPGQVEQVVLNLAVNARDAMPLGGTLRIRCMGAEHRREENGTVAPPQRCVVIAVSDTGDGIPAEVQPHIFDPFYTTKEMGRGTGLGLSTVHGIVEQSGGHITIDSVPGRGTTFTVYFPRLESGLEAESELREPLEGMEGGSGEVILVVEDEDGVRALAERILTRLGYTVQVAREGLDALAIYDRSEGAVDLVLTDVIMPTMGGTELAERLHRMNPELPILFMSGYADDQLAKRSLLDPHTTLIEKPFTMETLARQVRKAFSASRAGRSG